ncbi:MAG: CapA family protein [Saprospiraceae bacterium]|jgi:poly-gamma-glutamate capsule biosynthesis protein CapA/YwtB (metallophosphatase superfamily)|nr:CapA family protein [Saprospiraceae bacterium]
MRTPLPIATFLFCLCALPLGAQTDTLRLIFAGDIMGHAPQIKSAETGPGQYDYRPCFRYVKPILEQADLAIGNLELTLPGKGPYSGYPMFRSPDALAVALHDAGFDILVTANNHSNDSRGPGVVSTIETVRELGFQQTGTFKSRRDRELFYPLMVYRNGFKLALLNYTYDTNGVPTEAPTVVNLIDTMQIAADLAEARSRKPHFIIVVMHWGLEYQLHENAEQRKLANFLIRNGADMIIGAHPHVVQPIREETVTLPDGSKKSAVVVYSLGNFISNQQKPGTDGGILFQVDLLHRKGVPYAEVGAYGYIPVWRYIHRDAKGKSTFFAVPTDRPPTDLTMPATATNAMRTYAEGLRKRL